MIASNSSSGRKECKAMGVLLFYVNQKRLSLHLWLYPRLKETIYSQAVCRQAVLKIWTILISTRKIS